MNKKELVDYTAEASGLEKKVIDLALTTLLSGIMENVAKGEKVTLVGFGTFQLRQRKERQCRNPKTGESVTVPSKTVPGFSSGKTYKEIVAAANPN